MLRAGIYTIFTGDAGALSYLMILAASCAVFMCRQTLPSPGRSTCRLRPVGAGFLLLIASRFVHTTALFANIPWIQLVSHVAGLLGLYYLFVSVIIPHGRRRSALFRERVLLSGVVSGVTLGGALFLAVSGGNPGSIVLSLFYSFAGFLPVGMLAGSLWEGRRAGRSGMLLLTVSGSLLASGTVLAALGHIDIIGPAPFWGQLLSLADLAGVFILVVWSFIDQDASAAGTARRGKETGEILVQQPDAAFRQAGPAADAGILAIGRRIAADEPAERIFNETVEQIARRTGAEFIVLWMARSGDGYFSAESFEGRKKREDVPLPISRIPRDHFLGLCPKDGSIDEPFLLTEEAAGDLGDEILPPGARWNGDYLFIYPVVGSGSVHGFFTVGFYENRPSAEVFELLDLHASCLMLVVQRERLRERLRDKEKTLTMCKEELNSVNELKANFLSIISHELRTPLTSVKAYTETLLDNASTIRPETLKDFLRVMDEENERLIRLIDNILNYSCMETGNLKVERTSCNLGDMIEDVHNTLQKKFLMGKVNSDIRLPKQQVVIGADRELIRQLLTNLMSNAVKFTPTMGKITVTLDEEASAVRISVQDTGKGVPEDQLEKVFERFHQVDTSDTREHGGSGLGLAICKNIVEWHDGKIWVENVKEAGAKFVVLLPRKDIVVRQTVAAGFIGSIRFEKERYLALLVEMVSEFLQARKASIMLIEEDEHVLRIAAAKGLDPDFVQSTKLEVGERFAGRVAQTGESIHVVDIERDKKIGRANNTAFYGTHSFISVPLKDGKEIMGVLNVSDHVDGREFSKADRELLESLACIVVGMLAKLEAYAKVTSNFEKLKEAMHSILDIREAWGSRNLFNFTQLALATGRKLNLDERSLTALRLGMNVYDLGMMKVPRNIRMKKEELDDNDWEKLKQHTNIGYSLVSPMGLEERIMRMIRSHHEFFDGSGYPDGLVGVEIPVEARIVNAVDSFRALIMPGPYRRCFSIDEARNEVLRNSGTKFDPKVVGAFLKALDELGAKNHNSELVFEALEREDLARETINGNNETGETQQEPVKEETV